MAINGYDFSRYRPPGVYTESVPGPQIGVNSSAPVAPGIFGVAVGYRGYIESITINEDLDDTTPAVNRTLSHKGILTDTVEVRNTTSGQIYEEGIDYTVVRVSIGPDTTAGTRDDLYTISRVIGPGSDIDVTDVVEVRYRYTDPDYFEPHVFFDYDDVRDYYGEPFNASQQLQSELTLAAKFAFLNGAYQVVCVAVDHTDDTATSGEYAAALEKLEDHELVALVVPATGMQPLQALVSQHVEAQSANKHERRAILGRDGSVTAVSTGQRMQDAQTLSNARVAIVSPAAFYYYSPELNKEIPVGAQFMAAALSGVNMRQSPAVPLTRKRIQGFSGIVENQPDGQKDLETQNGLMVIEKTRRQIMWVRHGVSTDVTDLLTREWSITGQADSMVYRIRDYLENDDLIGQPILDFTLLNVKASAESALQSLVRDGTIRDYLGLKVRQLQSNPDVLEVSYSWLPAFPLNYIVVRYAVTLSTGDVTSNAGSAPTNDVNGNTSNTISSV